MRAIAVASAMLATLSACRPAPEPQSGEGPSVDSTTFVPIFRSRMHAARASRDLPAGAVARARAAQEQSIGIVAPAMDTRGPREVQVLNDTAHEVQTVARVRFYPRAAGGWRDTLWTRERGAFSALIAAADNETGLPVVERKGDWLRVNYAFSADGSPHSGWVRLAPGQMVYHDRTR